MAKILLVEDDKSLREIYSVRLIAEGYEIVSAGDGEEALAMAIKERPDLIVSDVMMPKISGFDMLDILRSTTETKDVKVIMMTALSSEDQRMRGEALGADRYLVKSQVGIEDVVRTVHDVLGDNVAARTSAPVYPSSPSPVPVAPLVMPTPLPVAPPVLSVPFEVPTAAPVAQVAPVLYGVPEPALSPAFVAPPIAAPSPVYVAPVPLAAEPTPAYQPVPAPVAVPAPLPVAAPAPMPQPIMPFSTPAPASLGERVISPLSDFSTPAGVLDLSAQMQQALNSTGVPPTPPTV